MVRCCWVAILVATAGCAPVPEPDAREGCAAPRRPAEGRGAHLPGLMRAWYGAESLCDSPARGDVARVTLGPPFTYDEAGRLPVLRVELAARGRDTEVRWRAYRATMDTLPYPLRGSGTLRLSRARAASLRRALSALEAARDDSTECIHCEVVNIEERRRGRVDWYGRSGKGPDAPDIPEALEWLRWRILVALHSRAEPA